MDVRSLLLGTHLGVELLSCYGISVCISVFNGKEGAFFWRGD